METESYTVKAAGFEGPFGLLLNLVEKRKLFINDVSLAAVTEDYISYMNKLNEPDSPNPPSSAEIASFVIVASTLLLIKSKSLLPSLDLTSEEEGDINKLEERLRLYQLYTKLGGNIKKTFGERVIFPPLEKKHKVLVFLPDGKITKESMMSFAEGVLGAMPKKVILPEVEVRKVISIEEMIVKLTERITNSMSMNFKDLSGKVVTKEERVVAIVGFLAMLELVRQGIIHAVQEDDSEDIFIKKAETSIEDNIYE